MGKVIFRSLLIQSTLAFLCMLLVAKAQAAEEVNLPRFLTYNQLMSLKPEIREKYLKGLSAMLSELEKSDPRSKERVAGFQDFLIQMAIPQAQAELDDLNDGGVKKLAELLAKDEVPNANYVIKNEKNKRFQLKFVRNMNYGEYLKADRRGFTSCPPGHIPEKIGITNHVNCYLASANAAMPLLDEGGKPVGPAVKLVEKPAACTPKACVDRKEAREDFKKSNSRFCIVGGFAQAYNGRTCPRIPEQIINGKKSPCKPNETACIQWRFGAQSSGEGLCAVYAFNSTDGCEAKMKEHQDKGTWKEVASKGPMEGFNQWVADIGTLCRSNKASAKFHCNECRIIAKHVAQLDQVLPAELHGCIEQVAEAPTDAAAPVAPAASAP